MKVLEMMNKLENLKRLQDDLEKRMNQDDVTGNDSDLMYEAADAIREYIEELYRKDIKV